MRPRGTVDLSAEVRYLSEQQKFSVGVRAQPQRESTSIEPVRFPYRLDHLQGVLVYRDGHLTFEHCKAEHGSVKISSEGYMRFSARRPVEHPIHQVVGRSAPRRPRVDPGLAGTAAESRGRTESHRPDQPPRQPRL